MAKRRDKAEIKTNALRVLDLAQVAYEVRAYAIGDAHLSASEVAERVGIAPSAVFKTLLAKGETSGPIFAVVPGDAELDLKALARVSGNRSTSLVALAEVTSLTGYVRGSTTVLAARKAFPAYLDDSAVGLPLLTVSAGMRGLQVSLAPADYVRVTGATLAPLRRD